LAEIYKIHGCCSKPNSLILKTRDYEKFNSKNPYLAAKLLTFFIEHPIIFLGYSLNDENIKAILHSIAQCLTNETISKLQDRMIFVQWDDDFEVPEFSNGNFVHNGLTIPIKSIKTKSFTPLYNAIAEMRRRFPASLLRKLKEQVYDLVLNNDPKGRLFVQDISKSVSLDTIEVVFGVGAISAVQEIGYKSISNYDLMRDVVFEGNNFDPQKIVRGTLPQLLKGGKFIPCFKYLSSGGFLDDDKIELLDDKVKERIIVNISFFENTSYYKKKSLSIPEVLEGIEPLLAAYGPDAVISFATFIPLEKLDLSFLLEFLKKHFDQVFSNKTLDKTSFKRLICLYDYLKYSG
jgi:hypothetical protein